MTAIRKSTLL